MRCHASAIFHNRLVIPHFQRDLLRILFGYATSVKVMLSMRATTLMRAKMDVSAPIRRHIQRILGRGN